MVPSHSLLFEFCLLRGLVEVVDRRTAKLKQLRLSTDRKRYKFIRGAFFSLAIKKARKVGGGYEEIRVAIDGRTRLESEMRVEFGREKKFVGTWRGWCDWKFSFFFYFAESVQRLKRGRHRRTNSRDFEDFFTREKRWKLRLVQFKISQKRTGERRNKMSL